MNIDLVTARKSVLEMLSGNFFPGEPYFVGCVAALKAAGELPVELARQAIAQPPGGLVCKDADVVAFAQRIISADGTDPAGTSDRAPSFRADDPIVRATDLKIDVDAARAAAEQMRDANGKPVAFLDVLRSEIDFKEITMRAKGLPLPPVHVTGIDAALMAKADGFKIDVGAIYAAATAAHQDPVVALSAEIEMREAAARVKGA
jgi:hypothetical protein